ncbi:MAG: glycosyltransferase family 39 protein [Pseudomonadales bacterium]|nr:glycosyltransferase family 39 protein [Pseudomonadales bacterium]
MKTFISKFFNLPTLVVILILTGTFYRAYMPQLYPFGFDQVQILTNAEDIKNGNLTLIGPRTGPAQMFTGPLVYYITAVFFFFFDSPWSIVGMSTLISAVTGLSIFFLLKKYVSKKSAIIGLLIWTFSPYLIYFDRIAWNPNLSFLASAFIFFPLLGIITEKKSKRIDLFLIFIGSFLGFQAHFSGLLLPVLLVLTLLIYKKFSIKPIIASALGFASSLLPTIIFDAKNGWLNSRGFISFLLEKESVGGTLFYSRFIHSIKAALEILGSLVPYQLERNISVYVGLFILIFVAWFYFKKILNNGLNTSISFLWISIVVVIFSFYRSNSPEYYFFILLPAMFVFASNFISPLINKIKYPKEIFLLLYFLLAFSTVSNFKAIAGSGSLQISNQLNMALDIARISKTTPIKEVSYDISSVDSYGMNYFVKRMIDVNSLDRTSQNARVIHVAHAESANDRYGNYGLWIDPRTDEQSNYVTNSDVVLRTTSNFLLYQDKYMGWAYGPHEAYRIVSENGFTGDLLVLVKKIDNPFLPGNDTTQILNKNASEKLLENDWRAINYEEYKGYLKEYELFSLVYISTKLGDEFSLISKDFEALNIRPGIL